ncbi:hypothetical protein [Desulfurivibrio dismutans]|uniref:hypothetical protein n=1 Tax=Desulfurivibrio dismutans TaxID=1398908 RepID=UPI0023DC6F68|nr:hypothetical protein [Desulfurivibrio alkaliphilus]MDF1613622.1 hypothetical protein [Desulfurivibrio alkaliphilus]
MDSLISLGPSSLVRRALPCALLVFLLSAYFLFSRGVSWSVTLLVLLLSLPLGGLFGLAASALDRLLQTAAALLRRRVPAVVARFLLFFSYLLGYIILFVAMVAYPLGLIMVAGEAAKAPALDFKLYSINFVLLLGLWSWLDTRRQWGGAVLGWLRFWLAKTRRQETP